MIPTGEMEEHSVPDLHGNKWNLKRPGFRNFQFQSRLFLAITVREASNQIRSMLEQMLWRDGINTPDLWCLNKEYLLLPKTITSVVPPPVVAIQLND